MAEDRYDEFKAVIEDVKDNLGDTSSIIDNKLLFSYLNIQYRVRMPNQKEMALAEDKRNRFKTKLLQSGEYLTRAKLIPLLKERGVVDIEDLYQRKAKVEQEIIETNILLAPRTDDEQSTIDELKIKLAELDEQHKNLCYQIGEHLSISLEDQVESFFAKFLTFCCTEKESEKDKWVPVWNELKDFESEPDINIINISVTKFYTLFIRTRI